MKKFILLILLLAGCSSSQVKNQTPFTKAEMEYFFPEGRKEDVIIELKKHDENKHFRQQIGLSENELFFIDCSLDKEFKCHWENIDPESRKKFLQWSENSSVDTSNNHQTTFDNNMLINMMKDNGKPKGFVCTNAKTNKEIDLCIDEYLESKLSNKADAERYLKIICDHDKVYCLENNERVGKLKIRPLSNDYAVKVTRKIQTKKKLTEINFLYIRSP